jgi:hypothetical protein
MEHPPPDVLLRFLLGTTSPAENRQVVTHLLARCPACATTLRRLRHEPPWVPPADPDAYDSAFDRATTFLRALTRKTVPPRRLVLVVAEDAPPQDSAASASTARRPWLFG